MKNQIAILGSTGSIGKTTFNIIKKDNKNFKVVLLSTNKNYKEILKQINEVQVQNIIVHDEKTYSLLKKKLNKKKIKIFNNISIFKKNFSKKIDYTMCAISGLAGLESTLSAIEFSKKVAVANKESLICAWNLIEKKLKKYKTEFVPVDSEHFSIMSLIDRSSKLAIDKIFITASGGPFLNLSLRKFGKINPQKAIRHPNWNMGKKISVDSATLMNKVFEVIEAHRIFNIDLNKFEILIHPKSYVHAIVKFNNGLTKILIHDTNMMIPIFNTIYVNKNKRLKSKAIDINNLNNLEFSSVDKIRFPSIKLIKDIPEENSLYETVLVSANDELVELFLQNRIKFTDIVKNLNKICKMSTFKKFKKITPKNFRQIIDLNEYVRLKTRTFSI